MASITTIYDNIKANLATLFPSHVRLPDPYNIDKNSDDFLKQGYAFRISNGQNTQRFVTKQYSQIVGFDIAITRQAYFSTTASDRYDTVFKALLGDLDILFKDAHRNHLESGSLVTAVRFQGIDTVTPDTESFWVATMSCEVEYFIST